jgi:hypothetical protein
VTTEPDPVDLAGQIATLISRTRFRYHDEHVLQAGIAQVLAAAGIAAVAEVRLTDRDRIDFLATPVGIEVKVAGTPAAVERQLRRYAASPQIEALILVTNRARHRSVPREIGGKPVRVVFLSGVTG